MIVRVWVRLDHSSGGHWSVGESSLVRSRVRVWVRFGPAPVVATEVVAVPLRGKDTALACRQGYD